MLQRTTMPHVRLVSSSSAAARRLSASTASTSERSVTSIAASFSPPRQPRSQHRPDAAGAAVATSTSLCHRHRCRHRRFLLSASPALVHPVQRGPSPPHAVKKTFTSFDDMIKESPVPVLVDFHANWCGPCKLMGENVKDCANRMAGDVKVVKVDTDAYPALASRFGVRALPTLLLFVDGVPVDRVEGVLGGSQLAERVRYYAKGLDKKFGRR